MPNNKSAWQESVKIEKSYPRLAENISADVLVVGAGITGITTAYLLSKEGLSVVLIEEDVIGASGGTALTTGFITEVADTDLTTLADVYGKNAAKLVWESGHEAIEFIDKTRKRENIECEFTRVNNYIFEQDEEKLQELEEEADLAKKLGFDVKFATGDNLGFESAGYIEVRRQAKFHSLKYIKKLADIANKNGVRIFEKTQAIDISEEENSAIVSTKNNIIKARYAVLATYSPFHHPIEMYFKAGLYKTYIIEAKIPPNKFKEAIYEDTNSPYHYFRIDRKKGYDRMIIGGEDHREDLPVSPSKSFNALENYLKEIMSGIKYEVVRKWTGPILEPIDGLPFIGTYKKNSKLLVTHGFSGTGITMGTISAIIFSDIIIGRKNKWVHIFEAGRLPKPKTLAAKGIDYSRVLIGGAGKNTLGL